MTTYKNRQLPLESKWTLLEPIVNASTKVLAKCKCGYEKRLFPQTLFNGVSSQCSSCRDKSRLKNYKKLGGLRQHPAYSVIDGIKQRCNNEKHASYGTYGAVGITVCDEWNSSYLEFCKWADNNGFAKGLTIDRIDVNKGYSPDNCRFIPMKEQRENKHRQSNNTSGFTGVSYQKNIGKWFAYYWADGKRTSCGYHDTASYAHKARLQALSLANLNYSRKEYND